MDLEHEKRLTEIEARSKSNAHRLDEVEKTQKDYSELLGTVKVLAIKEQNVENDVKEIKSDVKTLTNKPSKLWEGLVSAAIASIVGGIVGIILGNII